MFKIGDLVTISEAGLKDLYNSTSLPDVIGLPQVTSKDAVVVIAECESDQEFNVYDYYVEFPNGLPIGVFEDELTLWSPDATK